MPDLPGMPASIRCDACGFENTTTSLYCQDCGARLVAPPSAVAEEPASESSTPSAPEPPRSKARILSTNRPSRFRGFLVVTARTLVLAAFAALIFIVLQPPVGLPAEDAPLPTDVLENVRIALSRSAQARRTFEAPWSGQGLNAYLSGRLPPGEAGGAFVNARLAPGTDGFTLFVQRKFAGIPFHTSIAYQLVPRSSGMDITRTAASLGRLPLPAWAAPMLDSLNGGIAAALEPDLAILREARTVRTTPQKVFVNFGSPRP